MRRSRTLREHREKLIRNRVVSNSDRKEATNRRLMSDKNKRSIPIEKLAMRRSHLRRLKQKKPITHDGLIQDIKDVTVTKENTLKPVSVDTPNFINFQDYHYNSRPVNVLHVIESLGMGGAQTMMMELVNGLNVYFGQHINNKVINPTKRIKQGKIQNSQLYKSYGVIPEQIEYSMIKRFCKDNNIDVVLQHRISISKCLKKYLPDGVNYVLLNHTWNNLNMMSKFQCDLSVAVCEFLHAKTTSLSVPYRVILNGIETNSCIPTSLSGRFKTGRCHRLVSSKFDINSIKWMDRKVSPVIPGFKHYIIGSHAKAKILCGKSQNVKYMGPILNRYKKMSIIKDLDVYFYETFHPEGASVALLESLSSGVPVICKSLGGNKELVRHGVNGFIVNDRSEFLLKMKQLSEDRQLLDDLKESTQKDFEDRLHVRHTACKYMQIFEQMVRL